jgi:hypothetical protein
LHILELYSVCGHNDKPPKSPGRIGKEIDAPGRDLGLLHIDAAV